MPAKVVAISNMKGGVGKTTVAVALAHEFAKGVDGAQARVLLVDLDAQANASFWVLGDEKLTNLIQQGKTIDAYLEDAIVFNENVALARIFKFNERIAFQVRGEAFNLLNRVRWGGATSGITSTTFGRVTSQGNTPRRMQIGLKLTF